MLGDFCLKDSHVGDFIDSFPTELTANAGQINAYDVSVLSGSGATVHFDLYDSVGAKNHAVFAPFSHDADAEGNIAPEPASVIVWSLLAALGIAVGWWRRRRSAR